MEEMCKEEGSASVEKDDMEQGMEGVDCVEEGMREGVDYVEEGRREGV